MRTKEEVVKHLSENGYTVKALNRILGFLVGVGVKEFDEELLVKHGINHWEDFYEWWKNEVVDNEDDIFYNLLDYLCEQQDKTTNNEEKKQLDSFIVFLLESFSDEVNEE